MGFDAEFTVTKRFILCQCSLRVRWWYLMNDASPGSERIQLRLGIFGYGEVGHGLALGLRAAGLEAISAFQRDAHRPVIQERARLSAEFVNDDETPWDVNLMSVAATFC